MELEDKPSNELMSLQKGLEMTHACIKQEILSKLDELEGVEKQYRRIKEILKSRTH